MRSTTLALLLLASCATLPPIQPPPLVEPPAPLPPPPPPPVPLDLDLGTISLPAPRVIPPPPPLSAAPAPWLDRLPAPRAAPLRKVLDLHAGLKAAREGGKDGEIRQREAALARALPPLLAQARSDKETGGLLALATALTLRAVAPQRPPRCPPSDPCTGLDEPPAPRPAPLGVLDEALRHSREMLDLAATAPAGSPANTHARLLRVALATEPPDAATIQELGALARQLAGAPRTWALWKQLQAVQGGPEESYLALLDGVSREPGPLRALALDTLADRLARRNDFRGALLRQVQAIDAQLQEPAGEEPRPLLEPAAMGERAAELALRLSEGNLNEVHPAQHTFEALLSREYGAFRGAPWGVILRAVMRGALDRNDLAAARQAAAVLLSRAPTAPEAQEATRLQVTPPRPPQADPTWKTATPQLTAMVKHCAAESSRQGPQELQVRLSQTAMQGRQIALESEEDEGISRCLDRNGGSFLGGLLEGAWVVRLKARLSP